MSKTKDTSKFDHAKLENRVLADSDLDAVSGGYWNFGGVFALSRPTPQCYRKRGAIGIRCATGRSILSTRLTPLIETKARKTLR